MAQVKFSALVSSVRGKLNGSVFQGNKGTTTLRNKPIKRNVTNQYTEEVRNINKMLSAEWKLLTEAQRLQWSNGARSGVSGYNAFYNRNYYALMFGLSLIQDFPAGLSAPVVSDFTAAYFWGMAKITLVEKPTFPDQYTIIRVGSVNSGSIAHKNINMSIIVAETNVDGVFNISTAYFNKFGCFPAVNTRMLIEVFNWDKNTGLKSMPVRKWVDFTATDVLLTDLTAQTIEQCYATKLMVAGYAGSCMQVYRPSDANSLDIGFIGNEMDWQSAYEFANGETLQVAVWYNQNASGLNLVFSTPDNAPFLDFTDFSVNMYDAVKLINGYFEDTTSYGYNQNWTMYAAVRESLEIYKQGFVMREQAMPCIFTLYSETLDPGTHSRDLKLQSLAFTKTHTYYLNTDYRGMLAAGYRLLTNRKTRLRVDDSEIEAVYSGGSYSVIWGGCGVAEDDFSNQVPAAYSVRFMCAFSDYLTGTQLDSLCKLGVTL